MQLYEVNTIMQNIYLTTKDSWEQARLVAYIIAQANSKKKLKPTDIISFGWEEKEKKHITSISTEDIERLKEKAKIAEQKLSEKSK